MTRGSFPPPLAIPVRIGVTKGECPVVPVIFMLAGSVIVYPWVASPDLSAAQESLPVRLLALVVGLAVALGAGIALFVLTRVKRK